MSQSPYNCINLDIGHIASKNKLKRRFSISLRLTLWFSMMFLRGFLVLGVAMFADLIIMVTARDAMSDIIRGLDLGADDYLTKPFALDVLLARIRAVSRRGQTSRPYSWGGRKE